MYVCIGRGFNKCLIPDELLACISCHNNSWWILVKQNCFTQSFRFWANDERKITASKARKNVLSHNSWRMERELSNDSWKRNHFLSRNIRTTGWDNYYTHWWNIIVRTRNSQLAHTYTSHRLNHVFLQGTRAQSRSISNAIHQNFYVTISVDITSSHPCAKQMAY